MSDWWTAQQAAWIGAIGGSAVGVLGGLFGTVVGICAPRGIGRTAVLAGHAALAGLGVLVLLAGVAAVVARQPYHVYYPLLLGGFVLSAVLLPLWPVVRARYRQADARRLEAEELRRA
jgi:hypothetical protein